MTVVKKYQEKYDLHLVSEIDFSSEKFENLSIGEKITFEIKNQDVKFHIHLKGENGEGDKVLTLTDNGGSFVAVFDPITNKIYLLGGTKQE